MNISNIPKIVGVLGKSLSDAKMIELMQQPQFQLSVIFHSKTFVKHPI
jgi:hypothetical protein